ncbi:MAG: outer membrane protein assembly factor BamD [Gammaproteobacteria bacterium]
MNRNKLSLFIVLCCSILLIGCSSKGKKDPYQDVPEDKIYTQATEALQKKRYSKAIEAYESLDRQYPFGDNIENTHLNIIYAYYRRNEQPSALRAADRFIRLHPSSKYIDYPYYMRGLIKSTESVGFVARFLPLDLTQRDMSDYREAFEYYDEFVARYPDSFYAPDARQRMIAIRNEIADSEMHVARYYYRRGAYLASANRAQTVLEAYPQTPASLEALEIMADAYDKLQLERLSKDAGEVAQASTGEYSQGT